MIKPFRLRDSRLVAHLQRQGVSLDLEDQLTHPRTPLRSAIMDSILMPRSGPFTFILDHQEDSSSHLGLAQMRPRPGRPEVDVVFLAPTLDSGNGRHALWQRLLAHLCIRAGEWGGQRIYTRLNSDGDEYQIFRNVGFVAYAQDDIFQWQTGSSSPPDVPALTLRRQASRDSWDLQRLYTAVTPRAVQGAEGSAQGQWEVPNRQWQQPGRRYGFVWESGGEILAALYIRTGRQGHWLKWLLHDDALQEAEALIGSALRMVSRGNDLPVYCALPTYQTGLRGALEVWGFNPMARQTLMVKHIAVRVREWSLATAREVQAESAVPTAFLKSEGKTTRERNGKRRPSRRSSGFSALR